MRPLSNWANTPASTIPGKEVLPAGGHGCEIKAARTVNENWGSGDEEKLIIEFEIREGTQYDGFYARQFEKKLKYNPNANWGGVHKQAVLDKEGKPNPFFKGLINAVEESNPGYNFERANFDERTLIGKKVGLVFRDAPFESDDGNVYHTMKVAWACPYEEWQAQPVPKPFEVRKRKAPAFDVSKMVEDNDSQLPF